jgi:hypothetical protein
MSMSGDWGTEQSYQSFCKNIHDSIQSNGGNLDVVKVLKSLGRETLKNLHENLPYTTRWEEKYKILFRE